MRATGDQCFEQMKDYLTLLQEPIGRMSTASSVFKGFAATIVTGVSALSFGEVKFIVLVLAFVPLLAFAALDIYYLRLEKQYRGLYNDVLMGRHPIDYSISLPKGRKEIKRAKATIWNCLCSPSIWLFYPLMFGVLCTICVLKYTGGV